MRVANHRRACLTLPVLSLVLLFLVGPTVEAAAQCLETPGGLVTCVIPLDPSGTVFSEEAEWAAAEWEWAMPIGSNVYFVPLGDSYFNPLIWFADFGAELADSNAVSGTAKIPPGTTDPIVAAKIVLNAKFMAAGEYYGDDEACASAQHSERYHVRSLFKHEIGHALGMMHADEDVMKCPMMPCEEFDEIGIGALAYHFMALRGLGTCEPLSVDGADDEENDGEYGSLRKLSVSVAPSPFNPRTTVKYAVETAGHVRIDIYDSRGRFIATAVDEWREPGTYTVLWGGTDQVRQLVSAGVYIIRLVADGRKTSTRAVLLK